METARSPAEQKVILDNIDWKTYGGLLAAHRDSSAPRFTYDRGMLEILSPGFKHESINRRLALIVDVLTEEVEVEVVSAGSTTFKREDLDRGFEPDSCFYIQNEALVRGKELLDLAVDPPPDLVIEVDITSPSLNKLPVYAALGVTEIWLHRGRDTAILVFEGGEYVAANRSRAFPELTPTVLSRFVERGETLLRTAWLREVRGWAREQARDRT